MWFKSEGKAAFAAELPRGWYNPEHVSQQPALLLNRCHSTAPSVQGPAGAASASVLARSLCAAGSENRLLWGCSSFFLHFFLEMSEN